MSPRFSPSKASISAGWRTASSFTWSAGRPGAATAAAKSALAPEGARFASAPAESMAAAAAAISANLRMNNSPKNLSPTATPRANAAQQVSTKLRCRATRGAPRLPFGRAVTAGSHRLAEQGQRIALAQTHRDNDVRAIPVQYRNVTGGDFCHYYIRDSWRGRLAR